MKKIHKIKNFQEAQKVRILSEFKEIQELRAKANKRYEELKKEVLENISAGVYEDYVLTFEKREVKEFVVKARTDIIVKVNRL